MLLMVKHIVKLTILVLFVRFKKWMLKNGLHRLKLKLLVVKFKCVGVNGTRNQLSLHLMLFGVLSIARFAVKNTLSDFKNH